MKSVISKTIQIGITVIVLAVSLYYALKDVQAEELFKAFSQANYWWVFLSIPPVLLSHWVRGKRWVTFMEPIKKNVSSLHAFSAVMIGNSLNSMIPRSGELVRPYVMSRREDMKMSTVLATVFMERVIDVVTLALLIVIVFYFLYEIVSNAFPELASKLTWAFLPLIGLTVLMVLMLKTSLGEKMMALMVRPFSESFYIRLKGLLSSFNDGFAVLSTPSMYLRILFETIGIWLLYAVPMYFVFFAFNLKGQYDMGVIDALIIMVIGAMAYTVAPTPGAIGVYHVMVQTLLTELYGFSIEHATAYAFVAHAISFLTNLFGGIVFLLWEQSKGLSFSLKNISVKGSTSEA
jgi:uncharacterized protein (TIRG00374 family)